jgi:CHAT domain-containing protein
LEAARLHEFPIARLRAAGFLTGFLATAGQYRDAAQLQYESLEFFWSRPLPYARGQELYHDMVPANEGLGRFHAAKAAAEAAAQMAQRSGVAMNEAVNRARWAGFAARLGLNAEAAEQYAIAERLFDRMADTSAVQGYRAFAEAFAAESGDRAALTRFEPMVKASSNPFVLVAYLHTTATLAEGAAQKADARRRLSEAIGIVEKNAGASRGTLEVLEWRDQLQSCYRDLTQSYLHEKDVAAAYRTWQNFLRADATLQGFRAAAIGAEGAPVTVVTLAKLGNRYGVWVNAGDSVRFAWANRDAQSIDRLARGFAALCADRRTSWESAQTAARPLRTELLDFALDGMPRDTVVLIQPDGELARIPWSAIALSDGEPLGERYSIAVLPTPVVDSGPVRIPALQIRHALIVGATLFDPGRRSQYRPLPGLDDEIAAVRNAFPSADLLTDAAATSTNISRALGHADALHFAGHAVLTGGRVHLLVAPDESSASGLWRPSGGERQLSLAVLSACSTGRYRDAEDPKPEDLASALLLQGTRQVIASLWDADSAAASFFMQSFYRNLRLHGSPAQAVREAMSETRRHPAWSSPYYWASFSLFVRV